MDLCIDSWKGKSGVPSVFELICVAETPLELDADDAKTEAVSTSRNSVHCWYYCNVTRKLRGVEDISLFSVSAYGLLALISDYCHNSKLC